MKCTVTVRDGGSVKADILVQFFSKKEMKRDAAKVLAGLGIIASPDGDFKAAAGELSLLYRQISGKSASRVLLAGIGEGKTTEDFRKAADAVARKAVDLHLGVLAIDCSPVDEWSKQSGHKQEELAAILVEGVLYGSYRFDRLKSGKLDKEEKKAGKLKGIDELVLAGCGDRLEAVEKGAGKGMIVGECQNRARDLVNLPGNHLSAEALADAAIEAGKRGGFEVTVFDKKKITELGMGGLLAVNKGSEEPPTFTILDYKPKGKSKKTIALVGKGVTFDSGGISLKPAQGMEEMKSDMSGAAAVIATVEAVAGLGLPLRVIGLVPATDNMPGGSAQKPGDVITTMSGITVEVGNTDAEGRLILADALTYAKKEYDPDVIVDLATLTGACIVALGNSVAGLFSNDDKLAESIFEAGQSSGEKVWKMPLWDEYDELIKSDVADVHNTGGRGAGSVTAAKFLQKFIDGHKRWAHIDIAGPAFPAKGGSKTPGATGFGVRLVLDLLKGWS
ncbi:leucyl aminopeptidase [Chlorobaculum thiosulfatiphilum]|uniref:Probable cytosol aminopeptidase n=1 Tax=Chlorobaculum thiosulfatiphilum TaxID=115852 RepID=A0A5C4S8U0_CHLTI|nr:leucyl aminopeptidase [Chlorobaculum thiosulfatiphilum]TNJ39379.1 leucyl aminopeptidase [Chlorobaculum thiosulfatiphilum]